MRPHPVPLESITLIPSQAAHSSNYIRINTCKSVSKQRTLTTFRINTYTKTGGGGWPFSSHLPWCPASGGSAACGDSTSSSRRLTFRHARFRRSFPRHRDEKPLTVSPLKSALTDCDAHKSFRMRSYENCRVSLTLSFQNPKESLEVCFPFWSRPSEKACLHWNLPWYPASGAAACGDSFFPEHETCKRATFKRSFRVPTRFARGCPLCKMSIHDHEIALHPVYGPTNLTHWPIQVPLGILTKESLHGCDGLERPPHLWVDFDSRAHVYRRARRTHQLQPASQGMPFAPQAAVVLPALQSQRGTDGDREGLRVRKGPIRSLHRRRAGQDRAVLRQGHGNSGVCEAQ